MQESVFTVYGMTCSHCVSAVRTEVAKVQGVRGVEVDLDARQVTVRTDSDPEVAALRAAVEEAGYQLIV
ncbi:MAG TPA: heavy metal-associated domain-containing protein [Streptosporangiaceae bacterium]|jgi:copper chaperone|nr:heavy metal-associated domain-containing protein [Streptosporangiaceae bacterium]